MQTIQLEFKQLDKLPVPESRNDFIFGKSPYGVIRCFSPVFKKGIPTFDFQLADDDWTYAHVKITAAETKFKVGDRVKYKGFQSKYIITGIDPNHKFAVAKCLYSGTLLHTYLTDLTLITNETT